MRNRLLGLVAVVIAIAFVAGCDRQGSVNNLSANRAPDPGTFSDIYNRTIKGANCNECHKPTGSAWVDNGVRLDFTSQAKAYEGLTKNVVMGKTSKGICTNVRLVFPKNARSSYLAAVLFQDYNKNNFAGVSGCAPYPIHLTDQNISAGEKTSILKWIDAGAPNN